MEGSSSIKSRIAADEAEFPKIQKIFAYGTAGFRTLGDQLDRVCYRCGILAALRQISYPDISLPRAKVTGLSGVMITASHNPKEDNGVKIIESTGEMLVPEWEKLAEALVNAEDVFGVLQQLEGAEGVAGVKVEGGLLEREGNNLRGMVYVGYDTRESSERLAKALERGVKAVNGVSTNFGLVTTPQLHWLVSRYNQNKDLSPSSSDYCTHLSSKFSHFLSLLPHEPSSYSPSLLLDCANGVGAPVFAHLKKCIGACLSVQMINTEETPEHLNEGCGAEFVQKEQEFPKNFDRQEKGIWKCAAFDGDADRLMYFYADEDGKFQMIDGDKQFAFIVQYIKQLMEETEVLGEVSLMLVQTAYVNSRVQFFLEKNQIPFQWVPTGVKYATPVVVKYDIGANVEANGHGTVATKFDKLDAALRKGNKEGTLAARKLRAILEIFNPNVGDAIANLLAIEAILRDRDFSIAQFAHIYQENPAKIYKSVVKDRTKFKTVPDESRLTEPLALQEKIDQLVGAVQEGKAFVRPSGTEDILRLYAEAKTVEEREKLAQGILAVIEKEFKEFGTGN